VKCRTGAIEWKKDVDGIVYEPLRSLHALIMYSAIRCHAAGKGAVVSIKRQYRADCAGMLRCWFLFDEMQPGAVLILHWFCQNNAASETCELPKLVLDCL
jgi:hypothetical protein